MSDFCQQPNEQIHPLNTRITTLVKKCKFQDQIKETVKIRFLQYSVMFHGLD